jgi:phosphatidylserine synthase
MRQQSKEQPMSDPNTSTSSSPNPTPPSGDWRDQRRADREARHAAWRNGGGHPGWGAGLPIGGLIIVAIGLVFLADNFGYHLPHNWWAVLILIPAAGLLVTAARFYRMGMRGPAMGPAIGGVVLLVIALAILLGLNWGLFWPVVLIAVGIAVIVRRPWR